MCEIFSRKFSFGYKKSDLIFDNSRLNIPDGSRFRLMGENGAGKSTLLRLIYGALVPDAGCINVKGTVYGLLNAFGGYVQDLTIYQNLRLEYHAGKITPSTSFEAFVEDFQAFSQFPSVKLKHNLKQLSTGERMRLPAFAMLKSECDILLLDEFIGGLDEKFMASNQEKLVGSVLNAKILIFSSHSASLGKMFECQDIKLWDLVQ